MMTTAISWVMTVPPLFQHGEIDCWPVECPPVACSQPVLRPGDCCPRCEDDPCALEVNASSDALSQGQPCSYAGRLVASGSEWREAAASAYDKCTSCRCKVSASQVAKNK